MKPRRVRKGVIRYKQSVEKPTVSLTELHKLVAKTADYPKAEVDDILNVYYDAIFDYLVDNREIHIPGIGRLWFEDPKPRRYWDERAGKFQHTLTYPVLRFKPVERLKDSLRGEVFRQMKRDYKAKLEALENEQVEKEFDKQFKTKKPDTITPDQQPLEKK